MIPKTFRFQDNFGRLAYSKYDDLGEHEGKIMKSLFSCISTCTNILGVLGLVTVPFLMLFVSHWSWFQWGLALWSFDEIRYFLIHLNNLPNISNPSPSKVSLETRYKFAMSVLENLGDPSDTAEELIGHWVVGAEKPTEAHLLKWLLMLAVEKPAEKLTEAELQLARKLTQAYSEKLNFTKARDGQPVQVYAPEMKTGKIQRKPVIIYRMIQMSKVGMGVYLGIRGFHFDALPGSKYAFWVRFGNFRETPLVFVVGLGVGYVAYLRLISGLLEAYPTRTIVLIEVPYINCTHAAPIANLEETLVDFESILGSLNIGPCSWMSHSYGSVFLTWVVNFRPHWVKRATFVDPINFRIWDASLTRLIFHDPPNSFATNLLQDYFIPEPTIAHTLTTHSCWLLNNIFPESLAMPTNIFLSDHEIMFDVKGCKSYLRHRLKANKQDNVIITSMDTTHGGFQYQEKYLNLVIAAL